MSAPQPIMPGSAECEGMDSTGKFSTGIDKVLADEKPQFGVLIVAECDPNGFDQHEPGAKLDAGKVSVTRGVLHYFPRALRAVAELSTFGAQKYAWKGWEKVPNAIERYEDALGRHMLDKPCGAMDTNTGMPHSVAIAWNALAVLEMELRR